MAYLQLHNLWVSELADGVAALVLDVPGDPANCLGLAVLDDLDSALQRIEKEGRFRQLIVRSGKENCFAAGPNLDELSRFQSEDDFVAYSRRGQDVLHRLQTLPIPSTAIIGGTCVGTGLELALACDERIAVRRPSTRLGFASAELGLLPAWGGTQRLPRLIGLERGLYMLLRDRQLSAQTALEWGLVRTIVEKSDDRLGEAHKHTLGFLPRHTWRQWFFERFRWGRWLIYRGMERLLKQRSPDDWPLPKELLEALRRGLDHGMLGGQEYERAAAGRLGQSEAFRNLLRLRQSIAKQVKHAEASHFTNIGIVGAGTRGLQISALAIAHDCQVVVREANETAVGRAMYKLLALLVPAVQSAGVTPKEFQEKLHDCLKGTIAWKGFTDLDLVIEALGPDMLERKSLFAEVAGQTRPSVPLVTESVLPPFAEWRPLGHGERLGRMHFALPIRPGSIVEVVGPPDVEAKLSKRLAAWAVELGCVPVPVRDKPGLLVQRIWLAALQEAIVLLQEGIPLRRVDEAMRRFGMAHGPLEQADLVGLDHLDLLASALEPLMPQRFFQDELLSYMADKGWLGQKTRLGFYQYGGRGVRPNAELLATLRFQRSTDMPQTPLLKPAEQILGCRERVVLRTVNEAAWCLEDGVVDSEEALDFALAVAGWAPHRGGPMAYARNRGLAEVVQALEELADALGPRFLPCPGLRRNERV